jgi:glycosyltransferase involved in cell wall biosynthesis
VLAVIETHPIQYHAPVYRALQEHHGVPVTAIYGSDFSVAGYHDQEFGTSFAWDTDLLSGYSSVFLSRVASGGARGADAVSTHGLRQALEMLRPDAVMIVGYSPRFHRTAWLEARRARRPVLFRGETSDDAEPRSWLKVALRRAVLGLAYRSCDQLMYIGERSRRHFERLGVPADRLVFSPYCVDITPFRTDEVARAQLRAEMRQELGLGRDRFLLLYTGKLSHRKGIDLLVAAARSLPGPLRDRVALLLVGNGDRREKLQAQVDLPPAVQAAFVGFRNQTELSRFYHAADLLVLPSRHGETWGLVVNEALHHGLPCVVSDQVGCAPDLIEPNLTGVVCKAGSAASLREAIGRAASLCGQAHIRDACRKRVSRYSVTNAAEGIARAFEAATNGHAVVGRAS